MTCVIVVGKGIQCIEKWRAKARNGIGFTNHIPQPICTRLFDLCVVTEVVEARVQEGFVTEALLRRPLSRASEPLFQGVDLVRLAR